MVFLFPNLCNSCLDLVLRTVKLEKLTSLCTKKLIKTTQKLPTNFFTTSMWKNLWTIKDSATDIWLFDTWYKFLLEVTVQNVRLFFCIEASSESFLDNCDKLWQWNKQAVSKLIIEYFIVTMKLRNYFIKIYTILKC